MKKKIIIIPLIITLLFSLGGCHLIDNHKKTKDEKVILALRTTYPGHVFTVVKPYGTDSEYYGEYQDEDGVKFFVSNLMEKKDRFSCQDGYLKELLRRQGFFKNVKKIALKHGCVFTCQDYNLERKLRVMLDSEAASPENMAEIAWEILNSQEKFPEVNWVEEGGPYQHYRSRPYEMGIPYEYQDRYLGDGLASGVILYSWRGKSVEEIMEKADFEAVIEDSKTQRRERIKAREQKQKEEKEGGK